MDSIFVFTSEQFLELTHIRSELESVASNIQSSDTLVFGLSAYKELTRNLRDALMNAQRVDYRDDPFDGYESCADCGALYPSWDIEANPEMCGDYCEDCQPIHDGEPDYDAISQEEIREQQDQYRKMK